jgi:hypothetical protein
VKETSAIDLKAYCQSEDEIAAKAERLKEYRQEANEAAARWPNWHCASSATWTA